METIDLKNLTHSLICNTDGQSVHDLIKALSAIYGKGSSIRDSLVIEASRYDKITVWTGTYIECIKYRSVMIDNNIACYIKDLSDPDYSTALPEMQEDNIIIDNETLKNVLINRKLDNS